VFSIWSELPLGAKSFGVPHSRRVMNISHAIPSSVASISFSFLSSADIKRISVKQIINPVIFDHLNNPNPGGLYDICLGPSTPQDM
jgi:DNA-directed RNA polymerase I subunit RPA1